MLIEKEYDVVLVDTYHILDEINLTALDYSYMTLFIYFLNFYGILYKNGKQVIDNNTLTALTLLIAESNPKEKEVIIDLVMNFLKSD